ncbi:MAG: amidohydrolase family protein [Terriglobia bacterium]
MFIARSCIREFSPMIDAFTHLDLACADPIADMESRMASAGIRCALAVETWKGDNLSYLQRLMKRRAKTFRVALCWRFAQRQLVPDVLHAPVVMGLRARAADIPYLQEAAVALETCGKWLIPHAESGIRSLSQALLQLVERTPGLRIYLPHLGWPVQDKVEDPAWESAVRELRQIPHMVVGISAIAHFSRQPFPHTDVKRFAERLKESWPPGSLVAASDYPLMERERYADYMHLAEEWIGRTAAGDVAGLYASFSQQRGGGGPSQERK